MMIFYCKECGNEVYVSRLIGYPNKLKFECLNCKKSVILDKPKEVEYEIDFDIGRMKMRIQNESI